jgi:uncharacterized membrane protein YfcA
MPLDPYNITDPAWQPVAPMLVPLILTFTEAIKAAARTRFGEDTMAGFAPLLAIFVSILIGLLTAAFIGREPVAGIFYALTACAFGVLIHTAATSPARARETKELKLAAGVPTRRPQPEVVEAKVIG